MNFATGDSIAERNIILNTDYLLVNKSERNLYKILKQNRMIQWSQQGWAGGRESGSQITISFTMITVVV
jgi:hypothetical protein